MIMNRLILFGSGVVAQQTAPAKVGVGTVGLQTVDAFQIGPRGLDGMREAHSERLVGLDAVGQEELHTVAAGTDKDQVGLQQIVARQPVAQADGFFGRRQSVDVYDKVARGNEQSARTASAEHAAGGDIRQQGELLEFEYIPVGHFRPHLLGDGLQTRIGGNVLMDRSNAACTTGNFVAYRSLIERDNTFSHKNKNK